MRPAKTSSVFLYLILLLVLLAIVSAPVWPYSRGWGYYPTGGLGFVLLIVLVVLFLVPGTRWW